MRAVAAGLLALTLVGCSSSEPQSGKRAPLPGPRTEVAGTAWLGGMVAAGGITEDGSPTDRVDIYEANGDRWRRGPALPVRLHHVGIATLGDRVYVAGGYAGEGTGWIPQGAVFSLGPGDNAWRKEPDLKEARGALALAAAGDRLFAMGGVTRGGVTATTEVLRPGAGGWERGPDMMQAREHFGAASVGSRVYAIAGRVGGLDTNKTSVESWDATGSAGWQEEPSLNEARGGTSAATVGRSPCVAGGEEPEGTIASVECLQNGRWERVAELAVPRHGLAVASVGGLLHVVGGGPQPGLSVSGAHEVFRVDGG
ncbi:MAG: hypothetical protein M3179_13630 [Actinomycetota bacterium]|nr:hypothetical protein [Actinomycetota bacterium]